MDYCFTTIKVIISFLSFINFINLTTTKVNFLATIVIITINYFISLILILDLKTLL